MTTIDGIPSSGWEAQQDARAEKVLAAGIIAVENQKKIADAALIAAEAFRDLVKLVEKYTEKMEKER